MALAPLIVAEDALWLGALLLAVAGVGAQQAEISASGDRFPAQQGESADGKAHVLRVRVDVTETGRAENCVIVASSGNGAVDAQSCAMVVKRMRFTPAKDDKGNPVRSTYVVPVKWMAP
jgi:protein TonB